MKIKYSFSNVSSNSDTIKVMANDVVILTLNKLDCTSPDSGVPYDRLSSGELGPYFLEDVDCNDLTTLTATGAEAHVANYTDEVNAEWKEFAHNKIGSKHFADKKWIATLDKNTPIIVYNQGSTHTLYADFTKFIESIPRDSFPSGYTLDLSNIDASKVTNYLSYDSWYYNCSPFSLLQSILSYSYKLPKLTRMDQMFNNFIKLKEAPEIPSSVTNMQSTFYGCTNLTNASEIPSSVTSMQNTFYGCTSLVSVPKIPSSVVNMYYTFYNCISLTTAPEITGNVEEMAGTFYNCKSLTTIPKIAGFIKNMNGTFANCTGLKEIDVLDIKSYNTTNMLDNCELDNINNLVLTGGYMYSYNIKSCKHLGVVTTDVLSSTYSSGSLSSNYAKTYIYYITGYITFKSKPIKIDAIPYTLSNLVYSIPSSSGYNWWVDYISTDNVATKQITQRTLSITDHIDTLLSSGEFKTKSFCPLLANPDYIDEEKENHTFELKDFTIMSTTSSSLVNTTTPTLSVDPDDPSKLIATLNCTNIKDNSISSCSLTPTIQYHAIIDGYKFFGETRVTINIALDFTVVEEMELNTELIKEEQETTTEELTE